jgi:hypothetical protein
MLLATDAFQAYSSAVGGTVDQTTGLLKISDPSTVNLTCFSGEISTDANHSPIASVTFLPDRGHYL